MGGNDKKDRRRGFSIGAAALSISLALPCGVAWAVVFCARRMSQAGESGTLILILAPLIAEALTFGLVSLHIGLYQMIYAVKSKRPIAAFLCLCWASLAGQLTFSGFTNFRVLPLQPDFIERVQDWYFYGNVALILIATAFAWRRKEGRKDGNRIEMDDLDDDDESNTIF